MREHLKKRKLTIGAAFFGIVSLAWLIIRTGRKPSRIVYPCQKAALMNVQTVLLLSASSINLGLLKAFPNSFRTRSAKTCILLGIILLAFGVPFGSGVFTTSYPTPSTSIIPVKLDLKSQILESASSTLFFVRNASGLSGNMDNAMSTLISLMQNNSLHFFKTSSRQDGLIGKNDVVLIKVNAVGPERAGTNTDLIKSLIKEILNHPEGFNGEVVIADNGQGTGGLDLANSNAYDHSQSFTDVANMFPSSKVSAWSWYNIRSSTVNEYSAGDYVDGYVVSAVSDPVTGIQVSYPKFRTKYGTYISFKNGIWDTTTQSYDSERLKVINCPVLKSHYYFGVTGSIKMYQGVRYIANPTVTHDQLKLGALGTEMAETRFPTLNLLDAIWVNANPVEYGDVGLGNGFCGPPTPYDAASYTNIIGASLDPVAMDYWAAKNILIPASEAKGYTLVSSMDPDNASLASPRLIESFHNYLERSMNELLDAGHQLTMNEEQMNVYVTTVAERERAQSHLSVSSYPSATSPNLGTMITGSLTPNKPNANISIWYTNLDSLQSWNLLTTAKTNSNSQYSYQWAPINAGNYSVKASWQGDVATHPAEAIPIMLISKKMLSTLTISLSRNVTEPQVGTVVSGSLIPSRVNVDVSILYRAVGDAQTWNLLANVKTNSSSQYSYQWNPTDSGSYSVKASWKGDSATLPTETTSITFVSRKMPSSLTISLSRNVTVPQIGTVVSGSLTPSRANIDISILYRTVEDPQTWNLLTTVKTNSSSQYSYNWLPIDEGNYDLMASWIGDYDTAPTETIGIVRLYCGPSKVPSSLSILLSPTVTNSKLGTMISGSLEPERSGLNVSIWYKLSELSQWSLLKIVETNSSEGYSYLWHPSQAVNCSLKASWSGDSSTYPAESEAVGLNCQYVSTSITISTETSSAIGGSIVTAGQLIDQYGDALRNQIVALTYRPSGATGWMHVSSNQTDLAGEYSIAWTAATSGYYDLKVQWAGNTTHRATDEIVTVSTMYHKNQYVFAVESNSTVSQLSFNETSASFGFRASCPNGTFGYSRVSISKGLTNDVSRMRLFGDGIEKFFTLSSSVGSWLLAFNYSQDVHQITINLDSAMPAENQQNGLPWYFFLVVFSIVAVTISLLVWNRRR